MADLTLPSPVIPKGSLILVTGANGFIASHVIDQLLDAGYNVRGTVRDLTRTNWLNELFENKYGTGRLETVQVPDITTQTAFADAVKGVSAIAHIASILSGDRDPANVIPPLLKGTLGLLDAAAKEPSVKRFVLTSSSHAVAAPITGVPKTVSKDSFNEYAAAAAWYDPPHPPNQGMIVYAASKVAVEKAVREWVRTRREAGALGIEVNYVLPSANFGPTLHPDHPGSEPWKWPIALYNGQPEKAFLPSQHYIDVRDTARLHLAALLLPDVKDERIFGYAEIYTINRILAVLRTLFPDRSFVEDICGEPMSLLQVPAAARAEELLRMMGRQGWTAMEDTIKGNLEWVVPDASPDPTADGENGWREGV
ncbi:putative aldehyde reductase [Aspergillus karnatakaensis]|uniref:putative aldehyde reductase n=1 Tax=Aspergillus karnatakaensis TaxID=1810916 RepID=UPI003CCE0E8E